jgi:RNA polymerase sigma factor (sigma-70 family)
VAAAVPESQPALHELAFEQLYRRYVKDVYRYTLALLQNPADAEDVTQTTFLNAWRAYRRGVEPVKPHNWLIKIAHNAARTRYAVSARRPKEVAFDESAHELPVPAEEASELQGVLQALAELPFNQRAALVMRELEGRSYSEISEALEVSVSAVETLIFRARRSLRLDRTKLRALGAIQLPPSLATFFGSGGGAVVGGGSIVGAGLLAKAAVVIATGITAGGLGYGAVHAADRVAPSGASAGVSARELPLTLPPPSSGARPSRTKRATASFGHAARSVNRPHVDTVGTIGAAGPAGATTAATPVERTGTAAPASASSDPARSDSTSSVATSTVANTAPIVTSVVSSVPSTPDVSSPIQVPALPPLPPVPPLPEVVLPPLPKLP